MARPSDGDLGLAVGGEVPGVLPVQRGGGAEGLGWPLRAQAGQARPAGSAVGGPLPAPREGQTPWYLGALGLGQGAALGQHRALSWEGQCAGGGWLQAPEPPVEVLCGALCGDRCALSSLQGHPFLLPRGDQGGCSGGDGWDGAVGGILGAGGYWQ